ncbi:MAG: VWA domain-containing protein [Acidobacteriaceae bacterium]
MIRSRCFPLVCSAVLALVPAWIVLAQSAATLTPAQQQKSDEGPAIFRTNANLVLLDVVVTDKGNAVHGLKASDFRIAEDGRQQNISTFEEHRATDAVESASVETLPPHTYSNAPRYAITSAANVLLLDALNTPLSDQVYVRQRMLQYLRTIPPGTRIAVFTLGSKLRMVEGFTTDSNIIEKALDSRAHPELSPVLDPLYDQQMAQISLLADGGGTSAQAVWAMNQFAAETAAYEVDLRLNITIDAMDQLARYLSTIPGRKNLIWYTGAVPINIGPDISQEDPSASLRDYGLRLSKLAELMALARVAVYPVDARGLLNVPMTEAANTQQNPGILTQTPDNRPVAVSMPTTSQLVEQTDAQFLVSNFAEHSTMDQIANETGGKAFYNTNAVGEAVVKSIANGANYYTIGYVPANKDYNGAYRKIEVTMPEAHAELEYRHGYYADDPAQAAKLMPGRLSPLIAAMQHGVLPQSQVLFRVRLLPAGDPELKDEKLSPDPAGALVKTLKPPLQRYVADFTIDPRGFESRPLADGRLHREMELTQVAYDPQGLRLNYTDGGFAVDTPPSQSAQQGIRMHQEIDLPAGQLFLRIGVHDLISGRIGTVEIPLQVAKP